jgi:hypothetical protein
MAQTVMAQDVIAQYVIAQAVLAQAGLLSRADIVGTVLMAKEIMPRLKEYKQPDVPQPAVAQVT